MKLKRLLHWGLLLLLAAPPILSSPLALLGLDPVKTVYRAILHYPDWVRVLLGIFQLMGGLLLLLRNTHRIGWFMLFGFGSLILFTKFINGYANQGIEEVVLLLLMLVLWQVGYPARQTYPNR